MTTLSSFKPFTSGPYETGAKAVNHVKIVGDVVMLIDNDDNPYTRAGGVYLYLISTDHELEEPLRFLDFLDYADLQFE